MISAQLQENNIRNQVGLELVQVDVEGAVESEGGGDGGDDLSDKSIQVGERWGGDAQVTSADIVDTPMSARSHT